MQDVHLISDHIISPLGFGSAENYRLVSHGDTAIAPYSHPVTGPYFAAKMNRDLFYDTIDHNIVLSKQYSFLETMCIASISAALKNTDIDPSSADVAFVFSSTKGNIEMLETKNPDLSRIRLGSMAQVICDYFDNDNNPIVVSNACISGVQAIIHAMQLLRSNVYKYIIVCGAETVSEFVIAGFSSFQALSAAPCKPFDKSRSGLNIGEACATMVLSLNEGKNIVFRHGATSNDANHLSGPSRTGHGLSAAIRKSMERSMVSAEEISYICAHGTATIYNDEMEAMAFGKEDLGQVPVNSLKGIFGHTLGAAGVLETIIACKSLENNFLVKSLGFEELGVSTPINIIKTNQHQHLKYILKTASGFGGGNAALIISRS